MDVEQATAIALAHERQVWEALAVGDREADERLLAPDFTGVYPSGFAGRDDHVAQFASAPTVTTYEIVSPRCVVIADDTILLAYDARFTRPGGPAERMYVSSIWCRRGDRWVNTFSQDTPATDQP